MINWTVSGELVFVTILSGPGNVIAPSIGSLVLKFSGHTLRTPLKLGS